MRLFIGTLCVLATFLSQAEEFRTLLKKVEGHPNIEATRQLFAKRSFVAQTQSSLKDPNLRFSVINLPTSSLSFDRTPMTSKQVSLSQSFPLTTKLGHRQDQAKFLNEAGENQVEYLVASARARLWTVSARVEALREQLSIVEDSLAWVDQVDKSTQRLYSTGKTNQINILEIKVRKSELETQRQEISYKMVDAESEIGYLVGSDDPIHVSNIPWSSLELREKKERKDSLELSLVSETRSANSRLRAAQLSYVPDLTVGAAYSFRENVDGLGDFVSGFVQFSIPLWGETQSQEGHAKAEVTEKSARLNSYMLMKSRKRNSLNRKVLALKKELALTVKSIEFADAERKLATKRYSLGRLNVFDLLEVELKLRKKKSKKEFLKENLRKAQVELLLLQGDELDV